MSEKTLKFGNIRVNKKEFHKSKQSINLNLKNVDEIVISDKFEHSYDGFKYFIDCKEGAIAVVYYLTSNEWIHKILWNGGKNMSFLIKDDYLLDKYNKIWR